MERTPDGVAVRDGATPILFYRTRPGPAPAEPWRLHYIHPLHAPDGTVLTEDRPDDHLHQRGVYSAWRRILLDGRQVADSWVMKDITYDVKGVSAARLADGSARISAKIDWQVRGLGVAVTEKVLIRAWPLDRSGARRVLVDSRLTARRDGLALAGTDDDKGYSGPSIRFVRPDALTFRTADGAPLTAALGAVETGPEVRFEWLAGQGVPDWRVTARCRAGGRAWTRWVLRRELSMQTCAFPGRAPQALRRGKPLWIELDLRIAPARPDQARVSSSRSPREASPSRALRSFR